MRAYWLAPVLVVMLMGVIAPIAEAQTAVPQQLPSLCGDEAPEPERPEDGLAGSLNEPAYGKGLIGSVYGDHAYAGLVWHTYDIGCGLTYDGGAAIDTWQGNQAYSMAELMIAIVNWSHYLLQDGGALDQLDGLIGSAVRATYTAVFLPFVSLALLVLALYILVRVRSGELADSVRRAVFALAGLMVASLSYLTPVGLAQAADTLLIDQLQSVQARILNLHGPGARDVLPTLLVDTILYDSWLKGEFGDPDSPQAEQFGRRLLAAQAFSVAETASGADLTALSEAKKADYEAIAAQLGTAYPDFQGKRGARVGTGIFAFIQALAFGLLQVVANLLTLTVLVLMRLLAVCLPLVGLAAIWRPETLMQVFRGSLQAVVLALLTGAIAGVHGLLFVTLYSSAIDSWLMVLFLAVVDYVVLVFLKPVRKLRGLVEDFSQPISPFLPRSTVRRPGWLRRPSGSRPGDRQSKWWNERNGSREQPRRNTTEERPEAPSAPPSRRDVSRPPAESDISGADDIYRPPKDGGNSPS